MNKHLISFLSLLLTGLSIASAAAGDTYVKVTSPDDLVVGGTYILAATESGTTYVATGFSSDKFMVSSSGLTVSGDYVTVTTATPKEFGLDGSSSAFTLKYGSYYLGYSGSGADLEQQSVSREPIDRL